METLQTLEKLEIETNKLFYDKKTEVLSVYLPHFVFVGNYKKSVRIAIVLDDIYKSLGETQLTRQNIAFVDFVTLQPISEKMKLKQLKLISKKQKEMKEEKKEQGVEKLDIAPIDIEAPKKEDKQEKLKSQQAKRYKSAPRPIVKTKKKESSYEMEDSDDGVFADEKILESSEERYDDFMEEEEAEMAPLRRAEAPATPPKPSKPASSPPPPGAGPPASSAIEELTIVEKERALGGLVREEPITEEPKPRAYEINMGLQYYSVMMEQTSYLFYIYLSHKELKIVDEEGKTVFETSFVIKTTKKEPPILNIRVEGDGFEAHPLFGKVEVSKDAVNPPVMIFSVLPVKNKKRGKKDKKEGERRHLHVYIDFEDKVINHSILSIIVQPKHFHLDIGPLHLDVSKRTAAIISFASIIITVGSLLFTIFSFDPSGTLLDVAGNFAPGLASILFIVIFLYTLFKEGLYPLKQKISAFLNFDQTGTLVK